jgi:hypothetical protein
MEDESKLLQRSFVLPMVTIIIGAIMVFFDFMTGTAWAGMSGTLVTGYFGLLGWRNQMESNRQIVVLTEQVEAMKSDPSRRD